MSAFFRRRKTTQAGQPEDDRWAVLSPQDIPAKDGSGDIYLHRFRIIKTPWFGIYLHDLNLPDTDRDPHDHPWTFWSYVISGGYTETVLADPHYVDGALCANQLYRRRWLKGTWHGMDLNAAHKIDFVQPKTRTLVFVGRRRKTWGFWTQDRWVDWKTYVRRYYGTDLAA